MLLDKEGLWYRVLKARYGEDGGRLKEGGGIVQCGGGCCLVFVAVSDWGRGAGLRRIPVEWKVEAVALIFGLTNGWGALLEVCVFLAYLLWLKTKG